MKSSTQIKAAPDCTSEILENQVALKVKFFDFKGKEQEGTVEIHKLLAEDIEEIFELLHTEKFPIEKVIPISEYDWDDEKSCGDNNTSAFNYRVIAGTNRLSKHATGCAIDINPYQNHFIKYNVQKDSLGNILEVKEFWRFPSTEYNLNEKGTIKPDSELVKLFKKLGWKWGGDWKPEEGRVDYQHFEKDIISSL